MRSEQKELLIHAMLPKRMLTALAGLLANIKIVWIKNYLIRYFLKNHDVNMQEAVHESVDAYGSFNDFFIRPLKPGLRPIATADVVSPVDGFVSEFGKINQGQLLQAKGLYYTVEELLASDSCDVFHDGSFMTLYLSPKDYHRVHMPCAGVVQDMTHVPGTLFSVQPLTTRHITKLFARNERLVVWFETEFGPMVVVLVGATIVGAIGTCWQGDLPRPKKAKSYRNEVAGFADKSLKKADELGYFKLGSTAIVLFSKQVQFTPQLKAGMSIRLGEVLGDFIK